MHNGTNVIVIPGCVQTNSGGDATGTEYLAGAGFLHYDVLEILQGLAQRNEVVGMDLVEVAPAYDPTESTQILAAQVLLNFIGFIFHAKR